MKTLVKETYKDSCAVLFFCLAYVFFLVIYPNFTDPNETCRFFLTSAIVEDHAVSIDKAMQRYGDTKDKSIYHDHFYAAKPIGYSLLAVPFYALFTALTSFRDAALSIWFLRFFLNLIPLFFFSIFFLRYLQKRLNLGSKAYLLMAAFLLGTLFYPFAQTFISHVLTGIFWFIAFYCVVERGDARSVFLAGAILGLSFVMEVLSLFEIGACGLYLLWKRRSVLWAFCVGVVLLSLPAFIYNTVLFGGPLQWAYLHTFDPGFQTQNKVGYVGVRLPSIVVLAKLLFGTYRGFFFYMPHLFFGLIGLLNEKARRPQSLTAFVIVAGNILFNSGMLAWDGGWCFGPRYIIPIIPFLVYGCGLWFTQLQENRRDRILFVIYLVSVAWTIPVMLFGTATFPFSPGATYNPILWENFTLFWRGMLGMNLGGLLGWNTLVIQCVAIVLVVVPTLIFVARAELPRRQFAVFAVVFLLLFPGSALFQRVIEPITPARDYFIIGICAHFQGNETMAVEFLHRAAQKNHDPIVMQAINAYLREIRQQ